MMFLSVPGIEMAGSKQRDEAGHQIALNQTVVGVCNVWVPCKATNIPGGDPCVSMPYLL